MIVTAWISQSPTLGPLAYACVWSAEETMEQTERATAHMVKHARNGRHAAVYVIRDDTFFPLAEARARIAREALAAGTFRQVLDSITLLPITPAPRGWDAV